MAWTAPRTWIAGEDTNASLFNTHIRNNLRVLNPHANTTDNVGTNITVVNLNTFDAARFTGNGAMTWTVQVADVAAEWYSITGPFCLYTIQLITTTVGGTPNSTLSIKLPDGLDTRLSDSTFDRVTYFAQATSSIRCLATANASSGKIEIAAITIAFIVTANTTFVYLTMPLAITPV
jgi:hypothetical protein